MSVLFGAEQHPEDDIELRIEPATTYPLRPRLHEGHIGRVANELLGSTRTRGEGGRPAAGTAYGGERCTRLRRDFVHACGAKGAPGCAGISCTPAARR